jgi:hypothetical protein
MLGSPFLVNVLMGVAQNINAAVKRDSRDPDPNKQIRPIGTGLNDDDTCKKDAAV